LVEDRASVKGRSDGGAAAVGEEFAEREEKKGRGGLLERGWDRDSGAVGWVGYRGREKVSHFL